MVPLTDTLLVRLSSLSTDAPEPPAIPPLISAMALTSSSILSYAAKVMSAPFSIVCNLVLLSVLIVLVVVTVLSKSAELAPAIPPKESILALAFILPSDFASTVMESPEVNELLVKSTAAVLLMVLSNCMISTFTRALLDKESRPYVSRLPKSTVLVAVISLVPPTVIVALLIATLLVPSILFFVLEPVKLSSDNVSESALTSTTSFLPAARLKSPSISHLPDTVILELVTVLFSV